MAFVDEITLHLKAGRGGDGVVRWRREKGKDHGGPSGGNGGRGGHVYAVAVRDIGILSAYKTVKVFEAEKGEAGFKDVKHGADGADIEVKFPVGSRLKNLETGHVIELLEDGQKVMLLKGGRGGLGNEHFKSSTNISPMESTDGAEGEEADFEIELLLLVDVGLIGLPNAGKSTLLNALTNAKAKIGNYQFTTLEPSLGMFYGLIIADIPGLIEGASEGKGLGHKFLRHIERTKGLLHCISLESADPLADYEVVRKELGLYNKSILSKPEVVVLTKSDMVGEEDVKEKLALFKGAVAVSAIDEESLKRLGEFLTQTFK